MQKTCFFLVALLGLVSAGCQTPYGSRGCAGGCCGGSCAAGGASYAPAQQTYAPSGQYQQSMPSAFGGGGSGGGGSGSR